MWPSVVTTRRRRRSRRLPRCASMAVRSLVVQADLASAAVCRDVVARCGRWVRASRRPRGAGVGLRAGALRPPHRGRLGTQPGDRPQVVVRLCSRRRASHAGHWCRTHRVLLDWVAASGRPRYPGYLPYYVAKAGIIALGEALALELAARWDPGEHDRARPDSAGRECRCEGKRSGHPRHAARAMGGPGADRPGRPDADGIRTSSRARPSRWMAAATSGEPVRDATRPRRPPDRGWPSASDARWRAGDC